MQKKVTIFITTDVHGTLKSASYADFSDQKRGLGRYLSALKKARQDKEILALDNGDILQGSPLLTYIQKQHQKPHLMAQAMTLLGVDFFNLGNHDFNYGKPILNQFLHDLKAPCLTSNITLNGQPFGSSQRIVKNGIKIGLIGVCTDFIPHWELPDHIAGMTFLDPIETVQSEIKVLRPKVDALIVMYHGGLERDLDNDRPTETLTGENVGVELAKIPGIDLLITGHQHRSIISRLGQTLITQCAFNATEFAEVSLTMGDDLLVEGRLVRMADYSEDPAMLQLIEPWESKTQLWLDQTVGHLEGHDFTISDRFDARVHKHPLVSLINQIQLEVSGAQLSGVSLFNEPGGFKANVTNRDIVSTYLYPNTLVVKKINGARLKAYLEQNADYFTVKNGILSVNPEFEAPKAQHFNYDMVDGIDYTLKIGNPLGSRVTDLTYHNLPIKEDDVFSLVINNYRASGGGNFAMIVECPTISEINTDMTDLIADYFDRHPDVTVHHKENIRVIL